jgi:phosphocarrier protein HPr
LIERRVIIGSRVGLHARPAALFVRRVADLPIEVSLAKNGAEPVDARSIMSVLSLNIANGDEVVLSTTADDAGEHLDALTALLASDLDDHE